MCENCLIRAVQTVKAVQRIPQPQRSGVTYYSEHDLWQFQSTIDTRTCETCAMFEEIEFINGGALRNLFPNHVILDEATIGGPAPDGGGLVHPNCRCTLVRYLEVQPPE